jgi:hypothetical protein
VFAIEALALVDHFNFLDRTATGPKAKRKMKPEADMQQAVVSAGWFLSTSDEWVRKFFDRTDLHFVDRELFSRLRLPFPVTGLRCGNRSLIDAGYQRDLMGVRHRHCPLARLTSFPMLDLACLLNIGNRQVARVRKGNRSICGNHVGDLEERRDGREDEPCAEQLSPPGHPVIGIVISHMSGNVRDWRSWQMQVINCVI